MSTCACCKAEERAFLFQPELGEHAFYLPGNHIRGFIALSVGDACKACLQAGESLLVAYKKASYRVTLDNVEIAAMIPAETKGDRHAT